MLFGYCLCLKPVAIEIAGLLVTVGGVAVMLTDPDAERTDGQKGTAWAYALCFAAAFIVSFWVIFNGIVIKVMPVFTLLLLQGILGWLYSIPILYALYPG